MLVAVFVGNPEGRNIYVGALPGVPEGELDYSRFLEFGNVDVYAYGGFGFVWDRETATMTRLLLQDDLSLVPEMATRLSFLDRGVSGGAFDGGDPVFISPTRAYLLSSALNAILVWNPTTMEITGELAMTPPVGPAGFEAFAHRPQLVGDNVIWQIVSTNEDTQQLLPVTTLAIASATRNDPVRYVQDERCAGANGGQVDARGDYYVRADAYWGRYVAYADAASAPQTCILRVRAGETAFDPDYLLPLAELTGSKINFPWFHVSGSQYVAWAWDEAGTPPADPDEYWASTNFRPLLVDIEQRTSVPYPDLEGSIIVSSAERELDGVKYYEWSAMGYVDEGLHADIVELRPEGIVRKFSLPSLWALGRLR